MCVASIPKDYEVRLAEARRGAEILGCELKILMDGGPQRIEDVKTCDLVGLLDGLIREYTARRGADPQQVGFPQRPPADLPRLPADAAAGVFRLLLLTTRPTAARCRSPSIPPPTSTSPTPSTPRCTPITAHASQFGGRGLDTEMYREFAHVQGRMIGVPYAEGLDVQRMMVG